VRYATYIAVYQRDCEVFLFLFFLVAQRPKAWSGHLILKACRSHTSKHHSR